MTTLYPIELSDLPAPAVIEAATFESVMGRKLRKLLEIWPGMTALLESDPAIKLIEEDSYSELLLRQRINEAAKARLLAYATDADLDAIAAYYGVTRLLGETDTAFRLRVKERTTGYSAAGGAAHYRFHAMSVSPEVKDVSVYSPAGGVVVVTVMANTATGAPSDSLLDAVRDVVEADDCRSITHTVSVVPVDVVPVAIHARIKLTKTAKQSVYDGLADYLVRMFDAEKTLGMNVTRSWIISKLHVQGVHSVDLVTPAADVAISPQQCASLSVTTEYAGRDF